MKFKEIKVQKREVFGSTQSDKFREQGLIPCVLYGGEAGNIHFVGFVNDFRDIIFTPEAFKARLHFEDKTVDAIVQGVQFHPLSDAIIHIDFYEVTDDKTVKTTLPISFEGTPVGISQGGRFYQKTRKLKIKGAVKDIPDQLVIDISKLAIAENLKVEDIEIPGLEILNNPAVTIAAVLPPKGLKKLLGTDEESTEETEEVEEGAEGAEAAEGAEGAEASEEKE